MSKYIQPESMVVDNVIDQLQVDMIKMSIDNDGWTLFDGNATLWLQNIIDGYPVKNVNCESNSMSSDILNAIGFVDGLSQSLFNTILVFDITEDDTGLIADKYHRILWQIFERIQLQQSLYHISLQSERTRSKLLLNIRAAFTQNGDGKSYNFHIHAKSHSSNSCYPRGVISFPTDKVLPKLVSAETLKLEAKIETP